MYSEVLEFFIFQVYPSYVSWNENTGSVIISKCYLITIVSVRFAILVFLLIGSYFPVIKYK